MKVALVHDYLNQFGGAERVLITLAKMFPDAPIYTLFHDNEALGGRFANRCVHTSFLDHPFIRRNHRYFIPLFAPAAETMNLGDSYDLIISDSAGFGKGVRYKDTPHIAYMHSPLRYAWEPNMYLDTLFPRPLVTLGKPLLYALQKWDRSSAARPDRVFTNSHHTRNKIESFYERDAEVLYPPVDTEIFHPERDESADRDPYYLAYGRIIHYKRFDLIVDAFNMLEKRLIIVGSGPESEVVRARIRSPYIEMRGPIEDENELRRVISNAKALIFPQEEDFGLVAAESVSCGTPVIAFGRGGGLEIVEEGINGTFFYKNAPESLREAVERFEARNFDRNAVLKSAHIFSEDHFKKAITGAIAELGI